jgi:Flp pilus assembly pilin Flp
MEETSMIQERRLIRRARALFLDMAHVSRGQGLLEYVLIFILVTVVVFSALIFLGPAIAKIFDAVNSAL